LLIFFFGKCIISGFFEREKASIKPLFNYLQSMKKNTVTGLFLLAIGFGTSVQAFAQTPEQRAEIVKQYDQEKIAELRNELVETHKKNRERTLELAKLNGWPLQFEDKDGSLVVLAGVTENDEPLYKGGDNNGGPDSAAKTARVFNIRTGGSLGLDVNGQDMIIGMWEIGNARTSHQQLIGRITTQDGSSFGSCNESNDHATHVAGTLIGSGAGNIDARGIAYQAEIWAYDSEDDSDEALDAATDNSGNPGSVGGLLVSNHSYGLRIETTPAWMPGAYSQESYEWDAVMYNAPYYQMVVSAGNSRDAEENDELLGNKTSKNAIVVAAVKGMASYVNPSSVKMSDFSTYGPTDDKRIKPDISMKGVAVLSSVCTSNASYGEKDGTSMASPGVAGTLTLMQQHYFNVNNTFMKAATLKALMTNTADEAGTAPGPDYKFGWGIINAEKAVGVINGVAGQSSIIDQLSLNQGQTYTRVVNASGTKPLKVTIAWTDKAGPVNSGTPNSNQRALIYDLDVRVQEQAAGSTPFLPWKLSSLGASATTGDNNVDNIEQIEFETTPKVYVITVTNKGTALPNAGLPFSLVVDGVADELNVSQNEFSQLSVYPNPATDVLNINYGDAGNSSEGSITMYDLQGRLVKQFNTLVDSVEVSTLNSGLYILNIEHDGYTETRKVIVK
jgi:hypothetical protein